MIDADYDGGVFEIALSEVPERKTDLVDGRYELASEKVGSTGAELFPAPPRCLWA